SLPSPGGNPWEPLLDFETSHLRRRQALQDVGKGLVHHGCVAATRRAQVAFCQEHREAGAWFDQPLLSSVTKKRLHGVLEGPLIDLAAPASPNAEVRLVFL